MIGATLGSYRILSEIGSGGMGVVYQAEHTVIGRKVAVKILRADMPQEYVDRFLNEAKAAAMLHHPGLVDVFDFGQKDTSAYIVMEFLHGESLAQRLERERRLPPPVACAIARSVATALHVAHEQGIVHRDLKPANIFLIDDAEAPVGVRTKVLDFGIAKLVRDRDVRSVKTQSGAVIGTPRYMSPEQCKNARGVDGRADIYSLGCILYEMVLGVAPFDYDTWAELVGAHIYEVPSRPREVDHELPADVEVVIMKMLEKEPEARYPTMQELARALEGVLLDHGVVLRATPRGNLRVATPARGVSAAKSEPTTPTAERIRRSLDPTDPGSSARSLPAGPTTKPRESPPPSVNAKAKRSSDPTWLETTATELVTDAPQESHEPLDPSGPKRPTEPTTAAPEVAASKVPEPAALPVSPTPTAARGVPWIAIGIAGAGLVALCIAAAIVLGKDREPSSETAFIVVDQRGSGETSTKPTTTELEPVPADTAVEIVEDVSVDHGQGAGSAASSGGPTKPPTHTDVAALTRTFGKQSRAISECFNASPTAEQVSVRIQIDTRGAVRAVEVIPASVDKSPLGACIADVARKTSFGPQPKAATFRVPLLTKSR